MSIVEENANSDGVSRGVAGSPRVGIKGIDSSDSTGELGLHGSVAEMEDAAEMEEVSDRAPVATGALFEVTSASERAESESVDLGHTETEPVSLRALSSQQELEHAGEKLAGKELARKELAEFIAPLSLPSKVAQVPARSRPAASQLPSVLSVDKYESMNGRLQHPEPLHMPPDHLFRPRQHKVATLGWRYIAHLQCMSVLRGPTRKHRREELIVQFPLLNEWAHSVGAETRKLMDLLCSIGDVGRPFASIRLEDVHIHLPALQHAVDAGWVPSTAVLPQ